MSVEDSLRAEVKKLDRALIAERVKRLLDYADAGRLIAWIRDKDRQPANTAFTAGPERQVAYAVEEVLYRP